MSSTLATVGILSIGEMGLGIAKLLIAHEYRVVTNITGRRYLEFCSLLSQLLLILLKLDLLYPFSFSSCVLMLR
jgi:hypothetical protein